MEDCGCCWLYLKAADGSYLVSGNVWPGLMRGSQVEDLAIDYSVLPRLLRGSQVGDLAMDCSVLPGLMPDLVWWGSHMQDWTIDCSRYAIFCFYISGKSTMCNKIVNNCL